MKTVSFYSLGCRVNQYEIQAIREIFTNNGYTAVPFGKRSDICVINTCAVTGESERKSRNIIKRAAKCSRRIAVTGCYAQLCRKKGNYPENVFFCGGSDYKGKIFEICEGAATDPGVRGEYEKLSIGNTADLPFERYRAYVKIQDGCDGSCSYCIIPKLRGPSRSRDEIDIISEIQRLAAVGVSEIIFTGIEVSDYGASALCCLIRKAADIGGIRRIRLGSINPNTVTDEFIDTIAKCDKFCKHLHLSVQSGCGRILNMMRRPYSAEKLQKAIDKLYERIPGILLTADIISSFPTETEEEFEETIDFLKRNIFMHVHAFAYSPRPYTDAAAFGGQIAEDIKKKRNAAVIAVSEKSKEAVAAGLLDCRVELLVEKNIKGTAFGHTAEFMEAKIPSCAKTAGDYIECRVTGFDKADKTLICDNNKNGETE
ncbi:MAG: tRNA (N(6)-L-threonylcarbamoyladenosine(37)-C(2))-methylthiotransferase MtaB [Eubacteriales bacterium]|nr:tRNA (N(6)-L-threonylcarbamoyladenosine(37)-C(2))-methylthiotransferase MtaB [Eubacteriales bacterium]